MDVKLFLEYLPWLRKPRRYSELKNLGVDYDEVLVCDTTPKPRTSPLDLSEAPDAIQALYGEFDLSSIHMLWTSFHDKPKKVQEGWVFADMSETIIVMVPSGRIEAYNAHPIRAIHGDSQFLGALAKDMESYLEALLCGAMNKEHFSPGFADEDPFVKAKLEPIAQLCTVIAGGEEYYDFWAGLLGLPPASE